MRSSLLVVCLAIAVGENLLFADTGSPPESEEKDSWDLCGRTYPDGKPLRRSSQDVDAGSIFYPNGNRLYIPSAYANHEELRYPDEKTLRIGRDYADHGGYLYPDGSWLYVPSFYGDHTAMFYPDGNMMRVGRNYSDAGTLWDEKGNVLGRGRKTKVNSELKIDENTILKIDAHVNKQTFFLDTQWPGYRAEYRINIDWPTISCRITPHP